MLKKYKNYFLLIFVYALYLLIVPRIISQEIDCLMPYNPSPANLDKCNFKHASDLYLIYGIIGFLAVEVSLFIFQKFKLVKFTVFSICASILFIGSYYLYIRNIEFKVLSAPIYLDLLYDSQTVN